MLHYPDSPAILFTAIPVYHKLSKLQPVEVYLAYSFGVWKPESMDSVSGKGLPTTSFSAG